MKIRIFSYGGSGLKFLTNFLDLGIHCYDVNHNPHSRPTKKHLALDKLIVLYCDPRNALLSFFRRSEDLRPSWVNEHLRNLGRDIRLPEDISAEDVLKMDRDPFDLEGFFKEWLGFNHPCKIFVEYERLVENKDNLAMALEIEPKSIENIKDCFVARSSDFESQNDVIKNLLSSRYENLIKIQKSLNGFSVR